MKKCVFNLMLLTLVVLIVSCGKNQEEKQEMNEWPAMDDFHMIMAESFHPYKDSANIAPAIANAPAMAEAAAKWVNEPLPEKVNNDEVKGYINDLKQITSDFATVAASGDTTRIKDMLVQLHENFHKIQHAWYSPSEKEAEEKHEH